MDSTITEPRVWLGCLACYNEGRLVGEWLNLEQLEDLLEGLTPDVLRRIGCRDFREHEETWVMDHEGLSPALRGECSAVEARRVMRWIEEVGEEFDYLGDEGIEAAMAYAADRYGEVTSCEVSTIQDAFRGIYSGAPEMAECFYEETHDMKALPDWVRNNIDWDAVADDLSQDLCGYELSTGNVAYFWAH